VEAVATTVAEEAVAMAAVLVSGAAELVAQVASALRARGAEVTEVTELDKLPAVCAAAGPGAFNSYVQLPAAFTVHGDTAVDRVHHFYADGVLARFPALAGALPALAPPSRMTFVLGKLPVEVATADDREARRALVRVLGHAARADFPDGALAVRILDISSTPDEIALVALGRDPAREGLLDQLDDMSYEDLRVEMLGLVSVET
jgi:hypothetical protein